MARTPEQVVSEYFAAIDRHDLETIGAVWAPDGVDELHGQALLDGPAEVRAYFAANFAAFPDWRMRVTSTTAQDDRVAVHWRLTGTFTGEPWQGLQPNGARIDVQGLDLLQVADGRIVRNDAFPDGVSIARQIGMLPPAGSSADRGLRRLFNAGTRAKRRVAGAPETIAEGVWLIRGGLPRSMNVFLIADAGGGVTCFDAGIRAMTNAVAAAGASLGPINRVVLGHAHSDHRGVAPGLRVPVLCHPDERRHAEAAHGANEDYFDFSKLNPLARVLMPRLLRSWDGGPVEISGTVEEGDEVSGFRVVHLPGHAPGLIGLWRESDRLALTSDCFYTLDPQTGRHGAPRLPHAAFTLDSEQARASLRKLAALEPATAWPGHADPVTGDVRSALEHAAATT
jgi:hydroxyacylglutathione hydrolase